MNGRRKLQVFLHSNCLSVGRSVCRFVTPDRHLFQLHYYYNNIRARSPTPMNLWQVTGAQQWTPNTLYFQYSLTVYKPFLLLLPLSPTRPLLTLTLFHLICPIKIHIIIAIRQLHGVRSAYILQCVREKASEEDKRDEERGRKRERKSTRNQWQINNNNRDKWIYL